MDGTRGSTEMTKLHERAAAALDRTHFTNKGIQTPTARDIVAAWLDGYKVRLSMVRNLVAYLEMVSR